MVRRVREEAPELTDAELAAMRPASEVHTPEELAALISVRKRGRPKSNAPKVPVTIRLDAETAKTFRSLGSGWQSKVSAALTRMALDGSLAIASRVRKRRPARVAAPPEKAKAYS